MGEFVGHELAGAFIERGVDSFGVPAGGQRDGVSEPPGQLVEDGPPLFGVHRLLAAISNNVNQMARVTNATGNVHTEMVETLRAVRRTAERIDGAIDGLSLR